jgi:branched-chain amino acid transport system permease protein
MPQQAAYIVQQLVNVTQLASFYLPLALAFAIMQATTRRIFLGLGEVAMFASFAAIYVCFAALLRGEEDIVSALSALALAIACGAALGFVIASFVLGKSLLQSPLAFMIASIGFAIALSEGMRVATGAKDIWVPPLFSGETFAEIGGDFPIKLSAIATLGIVVGTASVVLVLAALKWTRFGLVWRACCQSLKLASLTGIDADAVSRLAFALAGGLAGVTGWTSAIVYGGANFSVGMMIGFKAMFASVIGGFGSLRGAVLGALVLAFIEVSWSAVFSTAYRDVAVFAIMGLALVIKPEGLLGMRDTRESEEI